MTYFVDFFFFQAEDGIRDVAVTGVQTCALPIWGHPLHRRGAPPAPRAGGVPLSRDGGVPGGRARRRRGARPDDPDGTGALHADRGDDAVRPRSEEHTSELQSRLHLVCRLLLEKKKQIIE